MKELIEKLKSQLDATLTERQCALLDDGCSHEDQADIYSYGYGNACAVAQQAIEALEKLVAESEAASDRR